MDLEEIHGIYGDFQKHTNGTHFEYGIITNDDDNVDFIRLTVSDEKHPNPRADLPNSPIKIEVYRFKDEEWETGEDLMRFVNQNNFTRVDNREFAERFAAHKKAYNGDKITHISSATRREPEV